MSASTTATATRWTCDGCAVSVSQIDGARSALPQSWASEDDGLFCLHCRRDRAATAALDAAPENCPRDARAKLRRSALIEFEVRRTPQLADSEIARACRATAPAVAKVREGLRIPAPAPAAGRAKARGASRR
jgi:hypothetical protein